MVAPTINGGPNTTKYGVRDEFGVPTSYSTWADASLVWLALRHEGRTPGPGYRAVVVVGSPAGLPAGVPVVNMLGVKTAR